jgi:hypothetical protein
MYLNPPSNAFGLTLHLAEAFVPSIGIRWFLDHFVDLFQKRHNYSITFDYLAFR